MFMKKKSMNWQVGMEAQLPGAPFHITYLQTCHLSAKFAVFKPKWVIHVNRVDPKSFCFGVGGVDWPAGVEIAVKHGENVMWCSSQ